MSAESLERLLTEDVPASLRRKVRHVPAVEDSEDLPCRRPARAPAPYRAGDGRRELEHELAEMDRARRGGAVPALALVSETPLGEVCALCGHLTFVHRFEGLADDAQCPACPQGTCRVPREPAVSRRDAA